MGQLWVERLDAGLGNDAILCEEPILYDRRYFGDTSEFSNRLASYRRSPYEATLLPRRLARAGFYFTGYEDVVKCYSCGQCVENFVPEDNPRDRRWHQRDCDQVGGEDDEPMDVSSQPLDRLNAFLRDSRRRERPPEDRNVHQQSLTPIVQSSSNRTAQATLVEEVASNVVQQSEDFELYEAFACLDPFIPGMANQGDRLNTFDSRWNANVRATPEEIARAGFLYTGINDRVRCWYCNGLLENWLHDDNPWEEHAKWFPTCEFVLRHRGPDYVHDIVSRFPDLPRPGSEQPEEPMMPEPPAQPLPPAPALPAAPQPPAPPNPPAQTGQTNRMQLPGGVSISFSGNVGANQLPGSVQVFNNNGGSTFTVRTSRGTLVTYNAGSGRTNIVRRGGNRQPPQFVDPRQDAQRHENTINQAMANSPVVAAARNMGFEDEVIRTVLLSKLQSGGQMFDTAEELVEAVMQYQEELARLEPTPGPSVGATGNAPSISNSNQEEASSSNPETELRRLEESRNCRICHRERATVVLMPCAHLAVCVTCAARNIRVCPVCRHVVTENIRSYIS